MILPEFSAGIFFVNGGIDLTNLKLSLDNDKSVEDSIQGAILGKLDEMLSGKNKNILSQSIENIFKNTIRKRNKVASGKLMNSVQVNIKKTSMSGNNVRYKVEFKKLVDYLDKVEYGTTSSDYNMQPTFRDGKFKAFTMEIMEWLKRKRKDFRQDSLDATIRAMSRAGRTKQQLRQSLSYGSFADDGVFRKRRDTNVAYLIAKKIVTKGTKDSRYEFLGLRKGFIDLSDGRIHNKGVYHKHPDYMIETVIKRTEEYIENSLLDYFNTGQIVRIGYNNRGS